MNENNRENLIPKEDFKLELCGRSCWHNLRPEGLIQPKILNSTTANINVRPNAWRNYMSNPKPTVKSNTCQIDSVSTWVEKCLRQKLSINNAR